MAPGGQPPKVMCHSPEGTEAGGTAGGAGLVWGETGGGVSCALARGRPAKLKTTKISVQNNLSEKSEVKLEDFS